MSSDAGNPAAMGRPQGLLARAIHGIRVRTTRTSLQYYLDERLKFPIRQRVLLFQGRAVERADAEFSGALGQYEIREVGVSELRAMEHPGGFMTKDRSIQWLSAKPCKMIGAVHGDRLVGYCWVEYEYVDFDFLDLRCPLAPDDIYVSKLSVLPGQRFGLGKKLMQAAIAEAAQRGARHIIGSHIPGNENVRIIYAAQGWTCFQTVSYVRAGWLRRYRVKREGDGKLTSYYSARTAAEAMLAANWRESLQGDFHV
jgi:ribosomal protein S18 acetylase RimI-like enzyme